MGEMEATVRIVAQEEIARGVAEPPALRLPDPAVTFARRAGRLRALAASARPDAGFLGLIAALCEAQQAALDAHPAPAAPEAPRIELCRTHGFPLLGKDEARDASWRAALALIVKRVAADAPPSVAHVLRSLAALESARVEAIADDVLRFDYANLDPAAVPFVAAALQVHWLRRATSLGEAAFVRLHAGNVCPVCGSPPVASVLSAGGAAPGSRYLHCALCAAEWHHPRGHCTQCEARGKLAYYHVEGDGVEGTSGAVKAEACDECRGYLKIFNLEKDARLDPVADDLATLALDVLMDESGYQRAGPNLFFVPGRI
jgi:FdhE protein